MSPGPATSPMRASGSPCAGCQLTGTGRPWRSNLSFPQGFQVAYVVFQKPGGVSAALALKGPLLVSTDSHPVKSGVHSQYRGVGPWVGGEALWAWHSGWAWGRAQLAATGLLAPEAWATSRQPGVRGS